jgi:hypothetical protein
MARVIHFFCMMTCVLLQDECGGLDKSVVLLVRSTTRVLGTVHTFRHSTCSVSLESSSTSSTVLARKTRIPVQRRLSTWY